MPAHQNPVPRDNLVSTDHLLAISKPFGIPVQGGSKVDQSIDAMYPECRLVHRLDRDTTGVLVLAKTKKAAARLTASFADRSAQKIYLAIVAPPPREAQGLIEAPIFKAKDKCIIAPNGLPSETFYKTLTVSGDGKSALVRFEPLTGRTHQIRIHALHAGFPLLGDPRYGDFALTRSLLKSKHRRLYLHAWKLDIPDPGAKGRLELTAPLPDDWPFEALDLPRPEGLE
jgi:23S rRNA pseudouridine955/2504/2580 synthase